MKILHFVKREASGLFRTTVELAKYEMKLGHSVSLRTPADNRTFFGFADDDFDIIGVHSQIPPFYYKHPCPKFLFLHGDPNFGMLVKVSITAIMELVPLMDAFICFNEDEGKIWNSFKRTYIIPKGIDLEKYKPLKLDKKLKGNPAILYAEHWRQFRHPFHVFLALEKVIQKLPEMKFYPFGCPDKDKEFWLKLVRQNRYIRFCPGIFKIQDNMVNLLNLADIVVSPVFPSYGRVSLEAMACGKPTVAYKTNPYATYKCEPYDPDDLAEKIIQCWKDKPKISVPISAKVMTEKAIEIYRRFL